MGMKAKISSSAGLTIALLFFAAFFALPAQVEAKSKVVDIEGMS